MATGWNAILLKVWSSPFSCSWVRVRASQSVLRLALRAGQQASHSPLHCLLLGSAFVSESKTHRSQAHSAVVSYRRWSCGGGGQI